MEWIAKLEQARWWASAVGVAVALFVPRTAAGMSCVDVPRAQRSSHVDAILLGHYRDLGGHGASFYFDPAAARVLGPIDDAPGAPTAAAGARGELVYRLLDSSPPDPRAAAPSVGFFERFSPTGAVDLATVLPLVHDPLVIGLLAGDGPLARAAEARIDAGALAGAGGGAILLGVLYAASPARAASLATRFGDARLRGVPIATALTARAGGLAAVAALAGQRRAPREAWGDYLPELAAAWGRRASLTDALDGLVVGKPMPAHPFGARGPRHRFECEGPPRAEVHGPFATEDEVDDPALLDVVARGDRAFAREVEVAFGGMTSVPDGVAVAPHSVAGRYFEGYIAHDGGFGMVEVDAQQVAGIGFGAALVFVGHRPAGDPANVGPEHLARGDAPTVWAGTARRLSIGSTDHRAVLDRLRDRARSGSLGFEAGLSLATLFELADRVPGWTLADFRREMWALPGNDYGRAFEYARDWGDILTHALRYSRSPAFAREIELALPTIVQRFMGARRRTTPLPAEVVRDFAIDVSIEAALLAARTGDVALGDRMLARAAGPLSAIAGPGVPVTTEDEVNSNYAARLRAIRGVLRGLQGLPRVRPNASEEPGPGGTNLVTFDVELFQWLVRPYAPDLQRRWAAALTASGYPAPHLDD